MNNSVQFIKVFTLVVSLLILFTVISFRNHREKLRSVTWSFVSFVFAQLIVVSFRATDVTMSLWKLSTDLHRGNSCSPTFKQSGTRKPSRGRRNIRRRSIFSG